VIIGVLMMIFGLQVFNNDNYKDAVYFTEGGLEMLVYTQMTGTEEQFLRAMDVYNNRIKGENTPSV
jgi:hypothetical protein